MLVKPCQLKKTLVVISLFFFSLGQSQVIEGRLSAEKNKFVFLHAYQGLNEIIVDSTLTNNEGEFSLSFSNYPSGIGYLSTREEEELLLILKQERIVIEGSDLSNKNSIKFKEGRENILFYEFVKDYPFWNNALTSLQYASDLYKEEAPKTKASRKFNKQVISEIKRLKKEENDFLASLKGTQVVGEYIKIKKLLSELPDVIQLQPERIEATEKELEAIDYTNEILYHSGILKEAIEFRLWFIQNTENDALVQTQKINQFLDQLINQIKKDDTKFQELTNYTLQTLQNKNLDENISYWIEAIFEDDSLCLSDAFKSELRSFKKLEVGAFAPDFEFNSLSYFPNNKKISKLSELATDYKIIVFAASWCGHCVREVPKVDTYLSSLESSKFTTVLVSLESDEAAFNKFSEQFNFIATTDLQMWESPIARSYGVRATPTYFVLNKDLSIMAMPKNTKQLTDLIGALHKRQARNN